MGEKEEVGTRLTLDDEASEALEHVKKGFEGVSEKVKEVGHELVGMAKQAAAFAIGFQLNSMIDSLKDLGEELVHNAIGMENENKELAGVLAMVDKGQTSFEGLRNEAGELNERLTQLGMTTGNSKTLMLDAFEMIAEKSTGSADHVEDMVNEMAQAAKTLPGGIGAMSAAWRDLESGIVRPRNALVQLMRQMGVVEGTSKQVAKGLSAMVQAGHQEEVFKYAEEAIARMAKRTKDMPLTFGQMLQSLSTFREGIFETAGAPIVRVLSAEFSTAKHYLEEHREEIEQIAQTVGTRVGVWITHASKLIQEGFGYLKDHADEIMSALEHGAAAIKGAVAFMVEHRELILGLAAAKMIGGAMPGIAGALPGVGAALGKAAGGAAAGLSISATGAGGGIGGLVLGMTQALPAIAAAAAAWTIAAKTGAELEKESGMSFLNMLDAMDSGTRTLFQTTDAIMNFDASLRRFREDAKLTNNATDDLEHFSRTIEQAGKVAVDAGEMTLAEYNRVLEEVNAKLESHQKIEDALDQFNQQAGSTFALGLALPNIAQAYKQLADQNQTAADDAARRMLVANEKLTMALGAMPNNVEDALARLKALASGKDDTGAKLPPINFGPSTFQIHQDFRDQDPERIAIVFKKDLTKNAVARIGARTGGIFGF